jgi:hypothetical protein
LAIVVKRFEGAPRTMMKFVHVGPPHQRTSKGEAHETVTQNTAPAKVVAWLVVTRHPRHILRCKVHNLVIIVSKTGM